MGHEKVVAAIATAAFRFEMEKLRKVEIETPLIEEAPQSISSDLKN